MMNPYRTAVLAAAACPAAISLAAYTVTTTASPASRMSEVSSCMIDPELQPALRRRQRRGTRVLPVRRLDPLPGFPAGRDRRLLPDGDPATARPAPPGTSPLQARHR